MWLGCLLTLWVMALAAFVFFLTLGLLIEQPWLLLILALLIAWRWLRAVQADRRTP